MNFIHIAGHLGADPEVRFTSNGKKVTTFRVATRTRKGQNEETIWWRVTVWGEQYDKMVPYLKKGSPIVAAGEFHKPEIFTDRDGKPQPSMDITASFIQFSPFGKPGASGESQQNPIQGSSAPSSSHSYSNFAEPAGTYSSSSASGQKGSTFDDEVPF